MEAASACTINSCALKLDQTMPKRAAAQQSPDVLSPHILKALELGKPLAQRIVPVTPHVTLFSMETSTICLSRASHQLLTIKLSTPFYRLSSAPPSAHLEHATRELIFAVLALHARAHVIANHKLRRG